MKQVIYDVDRFLDDWAVYMEHSNLSQKRFSEISGLSESMISRFLNRTSVPKFESVKKVLDIMGVPVIEYLKGEGNYILNVDCIDIYDLSIEEIDNMIAKLKSARNNILQTELDCIRDREAVILELIKKGDKI